VNTNGRVYSSKLIKAGALLTDSKAFLLAYDEHQSLAENLNRIQRENPFGKASRSRVADILPIFRQRFCDDQKLARALRILARSRVAPDVLDRVLYFHAASTDLLIHDFVCDFLFEKQRTGVFQLRTDEAQRFVATMVRRAGTHWGNDTLRRVTQGLLATLRDFGILEGAVNKRIAPIYLPVEAFAYIAFALHAHGASGARLAHHATWRLFLLSADAVEQHFLEAHQRRLLSFHAAGKIVRVDFPTASVEDAAHALVR
jgi:hypothetical protein